MDKTNKIFRTDYLRKSLDEAKVQPITTTQDLMLKRPTYTSKKIDKEDREMQSIAGRVYVS